MSKPVTITHVKENRKTAKKKGEKELCVNTMIMLDKFISLYNDESFRSSNKLVNFFVRNLDTPLIFKRALLNNRNEINIVPKHFMYGPRMLNAILTQLRCSDKTIEVFFCDAYYAMVPSQFQNIKNQSL
jgi:hypothetical protein